MLSISGLIAIISIGQHSVILCGASALQPRPGSQPSHHDVKEMSGWPHSWTEAVAGTPPLLSLQDRPSDLTKRDCLANGTNFCFGNNVNYCAGCGTCCSSSGSQWCCEANAVCCGSACCASGQTCSNGQCFLPVVTVTSTSTVVSTVTHISSQVVTVIDAVVETSTINSVVDVTISSPEATQTDLTVVTVTAAAKRGPPTLLSPRAAEAVHEGGSLFSSLVGLVLRGISRVWDRAARQPHFERRQPVGLDDARLARRQASGSVAGSAVTSTVIIYVTQTTDVTNLVSSTATSLSTSLVLTTVYQTSSIVLDAKTTVESTSTTTVTPYEKSTITIIETTGQASSTTATAEPASSSAGLPTPTGAPVPLPAATIAGIAVGSTAFALLAAALLFLLCRWRRRNGDKFDEAYGYYQDPLPPTRRPRLPSIPTQFVPSPSHHGEQFQPPAMSAYSVSSKRPSHHHRTSSGLTTLIGHGTPPAKADWFSSGTVGGRGSNKGGSSSPSIGEDVGVVRAVSPIEMPGSQPTVERQEMDDGRSVMSDDTVPAGRVNYQNVGGQWIAHQPTYQFRTRR